MRVKTPYEWSREIEKKAFLPSKSLRIAYYQKAVKEIRAEVIEWLRERSQDTGGNSIFAGDDSHSYREGYNDKQAWLFEMLAVLEADR